MEYFVTGASGFIGKRLVRQLLTRRGSHVHLLLRADSAHKLPALLADWGVDARRVSAVTGDLRQKKLGLSPQQIRALKGRIDHAFHLAAVYDLSADADAQFSANVDGTEQMVLLCNQLGVGHLHHISSIAAAGLYEGVFREDMFSEAENLDHPYFASKHEAEKRVRQHCRRPWTIYRPGMVVGDSRSGEMDKIDGPYYLFKPIQRLRQLLPPWFPAVGIEGGRVNLVPVDYVVAALDHIAHRVSDSGGCYHLVDPKGHRVGELLDLFARAAHAPKLNVFVNAALLGFIPKSVGKALMALAPLRRVRQALLDDLGLPEALLPFINYPTRFDDREARAMLKGSGIACPELADYAWRLWDHWERHLDPDLHIDRSLRGACAGKVVLVTGGSSGIGLASACKFAEAGAITVICGRDEARLAEALKAIEKVAAPDAQVWARPCDIADEADCAALLAWLHSELGGVDFLINNAGRSIRRAIENSYERFHDFERTMQLNYFGCLRITLGVLPGMVAKGRGHVVNISSIGVLTNAPRFSAYVASKAALDAWSRCAASEYADQGVSFSTINMPLVRTPMIAPTQLYNKVPALSPEEAADLVAEACVHRPVRIATRLGKTGELLHAVAPRLAQILMNSSFRLFPDSEASAGAAASRPKLSAEAVALQQLMRGIHF